MGLRIIAGVAGGRTLRAPRGSTTRPTSDRVREAIFSIVVSAMGELEGMRVLDLFAGSGALGLEALSRGAAHAVFVDHGRECRQVIEANVRALGFAGVQVLGVGVSHALELLRGQRFELVLADPPYATDLEPLMHQLAQSDTLQGQSMLVLEHGRKNQPPDGAGDLVLVGRRRYGDSMLSIYRRQADSCAAEAPAGDADR